MVACLLPSPPLNQTVVAETAANLSSHLLLLLSSFIVVTSSSFDFSASRPRHKPFFFANPQFLLYHRRYDERSRNCLLFFLFETLFGPNLESMF